MSPQRQRPSGSRVSAATSTAAWVIGAAGFASAGLAFLIAVAYLYAAEGPGTPNVPATLAQPGGQHLFFGLVAGGTIAVLLSVVGMATLFASFRATHFYALLLVVVLNAMAGAIFIGFLSLHYALAMLGQEGTSPTDPVFHDLAIVAHAAADLGGWVSIAIFALSTLVISMVVRTVPGWRAVLFTGVLSAAVAPVLFVLSISYLFTIPFGIWEILVAVTMFGARPAINLSGP